MKYFKRPVAKTAVFFLFILISLTFASCGNSSKITSGTDEKMISTYFPKMKGIEGCEWSCGPVSPETFFSIGPTESKFYGYVDLNKQYVDKILLKYKWLPYPQVLEFGNEYIESLVYHRDFIESEDYTAGQTDYDSEIAAVMLLDKSNNRLYFYVIRG